MSPSWVLLDLCIWILGQHYVVLDYSLALWIYTRLVGSGCGVSPYIVVVEVLISILVAEPAVLSLLVVPIGLVDRHAAVLVRKLSRSNIVHRNIALAGFKSAPSLLEPILSVLRWHIVDGGRLIINVDR